MEEKYSHAIKAGIIGGVLFIIISIISLASDLINIKALQLAIGCLVLLFAIIIAAGTGALAVRFARSSLLNMNDALIVSGAAGLIAGVIYAVMRVVNGFINSILVRQEVNDILSSYGIPRNYGNYSFLTGWAGQCCCAPFVVVVIIIIAAIGGAIYAALIAKIQ